MMKMTKKPIKHKYFELTIESSIGKKIKDEEKFLTLPSLIGFSDIEFRLRIREELDYLGMTSEELAKSCYINQDRMKRLIYNVELFNHPEIKEISRVLGF